MSTEEQLTAALARAEAAERERDAAIRQANIRDAKWMLGINETLGRKLNYDEPSSWDAASSALAELVSERNNFRAKVKELEAKCGDMREPLRAHHEWSKHQSKHNEIVYAGSLRKATEGALSSDCGKGYKSPAEVREMLPYLHHLDSCHMPAAPCTCGLEALVKEATK